MYVNRRKKKNIVIRTLQVKKNKDALIEVFLYRGN